MRSDAKFNPALKRGRRIKVTLSGYVADMNKNNTVMRFSSPATGDELSFSAADDVEIKFDFASEGTAIRKLNEVDEAVARIEARNGLQKDAVYADARGRLWRYMRPDSACPWVRWDDHEAGNHFTASTPERPLRLVTVGDFVAEEPEYELGAIYRDEGGARYLYSSAGWTYLGMSGFTVKVDAPRATGGRLEKIA